MANRVPSAIYLTITHVVSFVILIAYLLGALVAVTMSFDQGVHAGTVIMDIVLVLAPVLFLIAPAVISWWAWKRHRLKLANWLTVINWLVAIAIALLIFG